MPSAYLVSALAQWPSWRSTISRGNTLHRLGDVIHQPLLRLLANETEQIAGLPIVVIVLAMVVARGVAREFERRLDKAGILDRATHRVRLVKGIGLAGGRAKKRVSPSL
jgi:hypothetical protein